LAGHAPTLGWTGSLTWNHVGARFLNKGNTVRASAYDQIDGGFGFRASAWELRADVVNLLDRRDPVAESELGDAQYYRLPGRTLSLSLTFNR
jgi:outer membrane receptor protein involved in Fe transport